MLLEASIEGYHFSTAQSLGAFTVILVAGKWASLRRDRLETKEDVEDATPADKVTKNEGVGL